MTKASFFSGPSGRIKELEAQRRHALLKAEIADLNVEGAIHRYLDADASLHPTLERPVVMSVDPPPGIYHDATPSDVLHPVLPGRVSKYILADLNLLCGEPTEIRSLQSEYVIKWLGQQGMTAAEVLALPQARQYKLAKKILAEIKRVDAAARDKTGKLAEEVKQAHDLWEHDIEETGRRLALPFKLKSASTPRGPRPTRRKPAPRKRSGARRGARRGMRAWAPIASNAT